MKKVHMKAPALTEIYTQKILHDAHRKKLQQIREERKSVIGFNNSRLAQIEHLKVNKNKSFAHKFNQQSTEINRQNLRLLVKLQKTKPYFRYTSQENRENLDKSRNSVTFITPYIKRVNQQNEKENMRLSNRVNSISSNLNQKNLMRDFVKSQRIKQRISRYTSDNDKVTLKSQKYIMSQSKLSNATQSNSFRPRNKSTTATYYKKQDIIKNKVQNVGKPLVRIRNRPNSTMDQCNHQNQQSFFTTQPQKNKQTRKSYRK